jgi:hypothetical protein
MGLPLRHHCCEAFTPCRSARVEMSMQAIARRSHLTTMLGGAIPRLA